MGFIETLVLILITLKLCGVVSLGWIQCFSPFLLYPLFFILFMIVYFIIECFI